ncbi:MAG: Trk family potassium uptake protein [Planctomycetota bacterium]|nr:Trk family potassium uptake protein [Planctomycetota bacterium]
MRRARPYIVTVMVPVVVLAVGSLAIEYGFQVSAETKRVLHAVEAAALAGLLLEPLLGLLLSRERAEVLRSRWFHFALAGAYAAAVGLLYAGKVPEPAVWVRRAAQVAIVLSLVVRLVELNQFLATLRLPPALLFVGSFLTLIVVGTGFLLLPVATAPGEPATSFTDALFTATSGVCVTGLVVVDTGTHWAPLGRYVILALIQLGGLGLMTFGSVFALLLWRGMRVRESVMMQEVLTHDLLSEVGRIIVFILITTVCVEAAGAVLLAGLWDHTAQGAAVALSDRIQYSVFHSISAFCNAGFSLYADNLMSYRSTWQVNLVFPLLIISGGIGFMVLYNGARLVRYGLLSWGQALLAKRRLTLHSKFALVTTAVLLVGGTGLVFVLETFPGREDAWRATATTVDAAAGPEEAAAAGAEAPPMGRTWTERLSGAWFLATTARTAGYNTTDTSRLAPPTKFLTVVLMFIGASPGSTGGGIKTVTVAVIVCGIWSSLRGRQEPQAFRRRLERGIVERALTVMAVGVVWVATVSMILSAWGFAEGARCPFLDVLFETTSAFGTVGLSTGATPLLNTFGRILIVVTMFIGRVGPLTLFVAMHGRAQRVHYTYATEHVAIS